MKKVMLSILVCSMSLAGLAFRPPSVPLVQVDPFFSVWSPANKLTDVETTHWSAQKQPMSAILTVDGEQFRLLGSEPANIAALPQMGTEVRATQTICTFENDKVAVELRFSNAAMPEDLDAFSRPVTYVTLRTKMKDGKARKVSLTYSITGQMVTNDDKALIVGETKSLAFGEAVRIGRKEQKPLSRSGDQVRCDWGYAWICAPRGAKVSVSSSEAVEAPKQKASVTVNLPQKVEAQTHLMLAYDDIKAVRFFGSDLPSWWRRNGLSFEGMLHQSEKAYTELIAKMDKFDAELNADFVKVGNEKYAKLAALAWRQSFSACKLVADANNQPLYFSKENNSNGCIGTVDVFYPQLPHLLLTSPTLVRATLAPILLYASSPRWPWSFAPHDVGKYPLANKQAYWDGETQKDDSRLMPVEECGNMLICLAALSHYEGNADFVSGWWGTVTKWAQYLEKFGFDPGNQLCTDDFAGHLAHNANLSIKAILGLASYAKMADMRGEKQVASKYMSIAKEFAFKWMDAAKGGRNGAYRLAFDQADSWSMKYNLVWDRILGFDIFPKEIAEKELASYRKLLQPYGLPLDNRKSWTKADWIVWSATLTGKRDDFNMMIDGLYRFVDETPDRVPFSDWYYADTAKYTMFRARSVVGGVMIPFLYNEELWKKYASRDTNTTRLYAPLVDDGGKRTGKNKPIELTSFNIRCPIDKGDNTWANRLPRILRVIENRKFELMGVQEATPMQLKDLNDSLKGWTYVGTGREKNKGGEASSIFFKTNRFECLDTETFWLSETPNVPGSMSWKTACTRICTRAKFKDKETGYEFQYFNTHLDHMSALAREMGMKLIMKRISETSQGQTVFLTGDMNDSFEALPSVEQVRLSKTMNADISNEGQDYPISIAMKYLCDTYNITETPHTGTFKTFNHYKPTHRNRLDYVFVSGNVRVLAHATVNDRIDGKFPSDHDPVTATVLIDGAKVFPDDKKLMSSIQDAVEKKNDSKIKSLSIPAAASKSRFIRGAMIQALGSLGSECLAYMLPYVCDEDEENAQNAVANVVQIISEIEDEKRKIDETVIFMKVLKDESSLEVLAMSLNSASNIQYAIEAVIELMKCKNKNAVSTARKSYRFISGESFKSAKAARETAKELMANNSRKK